MLLYDLKDRLLHNFVYQISNFIRGALIKACFKLLLLAPLSRILVIVINLQFLKGPYYEIATVGCLLDIGLH